MPFPVSDVSFPVSGRLLGHPEAARLHAVTAVPLRIGTPRMRIGVNSWFSDAWWRFYVNDGEGMVVHGGGAGGAGSGQRRVHIPPWTLAVLPAWMPWRIEVTAPHGHCFIEVDCPHVTSRQIAARCRGAVLVPPEHGAVAVAVARDLFAGAVAHGAGNAVHAGVHQGLAHLVPALALHERPPDALAAVMAAIDGHLGDDLRVPTLARQAGLSPKTLTALFQRHLGVTPAAFVRERRLAQACHLLRETDDDIARIATRVGFANRSYLSRAMRRAVGLPPGAYRAGPVQR